MGANIQKKFRSGAFCCVLFQSLIKVKAGENNNCLIEKIYVICSCNARLRWK